MKKLFVPLLLSSSTAVAAPFASLDARSMAMGSTGVAASKPGSAPQYNPALLSNYSNNERISVILPNIGLNAFADPDAVDAFTDIEDSNYLGNVADSVSTMNNIINSATSNFSETQINNFANSLDAFTSNASGLTSNLTQLSEKPVNLNANALFSVAVPNSVLGFAVYAGVDNLVIETTPVISDCDLQLLKGYIDTLQLLDSEDPAADVANLTTDQRSVDVSCDSVRGAIANTIEIVNDANNFRNPTSDLVSSVEVAGVGIAELGVSLAHEFTFGGQDMSFGVTPKYQQISSFYTNPTVQEIDDGSFKLEDALSDNRREESAFNLDVGFALNFLPDETLTLGIVAKNLIPYTFKTAKYINPQGVESQREYKLEPQVRTGVSWAAPLGITLTSDLDLTRNKPYFSGPDSQYWGIGAEFDIVNTLRLRAGYRTNLAETRDQVYTAGFGINILVVHFDLAAQYSDNNIGGAFQFGIEF